MKELKLAHSDVNNVKVPIGNMYMACADHMDSQDAMYTQQWMLPPPVGYMAYTPSHSDTSKILVIGLVVCVVVAVGWLASLLW